MTGSDETFEPDLDHVGTTDVPEVFCCVLRSTSIATV